MQVARSELPSFAHEQNLKKLCFTKMFKLAARKQLMWETSILLEYLRNLNSLFLKNVKEKQIWIPTKRHSKASSNFISMYKIQRRLKSEKTIFLLQRQLWNIRNDRNPYFLLHVARAYSCFSSAHLMWLLNSVNLIASFGGICLALLELVNSI